MTAAAPCAQRESNAMASRKPMCAPMCTANPAVGDRGRKGARDGSDSSWQRRLGRVQRSLALAAAASELSSPPAATPPRSAALPEQASLTVEGLQLLRDEEVQRFCTDGILSHGRWSSTACRLCRTRWRAMRVNSARQEEGMPAD